MSESRSARGVILDKFMLILVFLYQRCSKKMSENAERRASSRPRIGSEGAADRLERVVPGRGSGVKGRPTASSVLFPAADQDSKDAADLLRNELTTPANMLYTIAEDGYWRRTRQ